MLHARTISPIGIALLLCSFNVTVRGCNAIFCSTTPKKQTSRTQHNPRQRFHTPHAYKQVRCAAIARSLNEGVRTVARSSHGSPRTFVSRATRGISTKRGSVSNG